MNILANHFYKECVEEEGSIEYLIRFCLALANRRWGTLGREILLGKAVELDVNDIKNFILG